TCTSRPKQQRNGLGEERCRRRQSPQVPICWLKRYIGRSQSLSAREIEPQVLTPKEPTEAPARHIFCMAADRSEGGASGASRKLYRELLPLASWDVASRGLRG